MDFLRNLFTKKQQDSTSEKEGTTTDVKSDSFDYKKFLQEEFGLEYGKYGWEFVGAGIVEKYAATLRNAETCRDLINQLRAAQDFNHVCVVAANSVYIVVNSKPNIAGFKTSLDGTETGKLLALLTPNGKPIYQYQGVFLMTLS